MNTRTLKTVIAFVEATPSPYAHHDALWWGGQFPAYPDNYIKSVWERANRPVLEIYRDYVFDLEREYNQTGDPKQVAHLVRAYELMEELEV